MLSPKNLSSELNTEKKLTLWKAAEFGDVDVVGQYLATASIASLRGSGATLTSPTAISKGTLQLDDQDDRGFTPIAWASRNGHHLVVQLLLEKTDLAQPVDTEKASFGGMRPLHHAC